MTDMLKLVLTKQDDSFMELGFLSIIPSVVNVLTSEFAKRNDKITYRALYNGSHEKQE
jgi:predicted acyltransferase